MTNFDRFSERTRTVLAYAHEEARSLNQQPINTGHLLLGLFDEPDGIGPTVLEPMGVWVSFLRAAVESRLKRGQAEVDGDGLSREVQQALEFAIDESRQLAQKSVEPEHLLLGLLRQGDGIAGRKLMRRGVTLDLARARVRGESVTVPDEFRIRTRPAMPEPPPPREWTKQLADLTQRAQKAMELADAEAWRFNHNYIGTEHLLLGLVREGDGVAARVLNDMGVNLAKVRSAVEFIIGRGEGEATGEFGLTPRTKRVIDLARDERRRMGQQLIGTEHLLLGLVREGEGIAAGVLESLGVNLDEVRVQVLTLLEEPPPENA